MKNSEVVAMLEETADLMEIAGENPFKARAYRRAAEAISALREPIEDLVKAKKLNKVEGIGESIARDITEFLQRGTTTRLEQLRTKYPSQLRTLLEIQGIGPRTVAMLYDRLKITSVDQLEEAAKSGKLTKLPGMGEQKVKNILEGIQLWRQHQGRLPLYIAIEIAERIVNALKELPEVEQILPAGSLRRWKETVGDLDILVATRNSQPIMDKFVSLPEVQKVLAHGPTKSSVLMENNFQVDLRAVEPESFGAAAQYFTGSKAHNIALRNLALKRGLTVNEYGVFREETGEKVAGETEEGVYEAIGLIWIPPELREDRGELEAAMNGILPRLVTVEDICGEIHCHSKWSDGFATVEEMAKAAMERGYEYVAITDHSPPMGWGVKPDDYRRLIREIRATSEKLGFPILAGIEVDIAPDGSLHMDEDILRQLDIVIAAVHSSMKMDIDVMTRRITKAMENPLVHIISHPTGRLINQRPPYEVRVDTLIDKARETGVALEINASPERLDLNDENARAAKEAGAMLSIGTDAHRPEHLDYVRFGVAVARRAWCEPKDILNTKSYEQLVEWLKSRR
ncbi:MAG: DNA polymerase/3'-5' exonuclease PolX [Armatimonadetes bacterium]|nr:DNA polymerase/3'-5' exonuclease PolX [Armatimonadota bacterium]MCX7969235.1 DNA polymerase/3'-5' exonuclease PolX [Armatimonadota bacterium]MDW8143557.1 DNA polymerase/3'-5' exonuclease PolX [Armatimonadota bacterium]